MYNTFCTLFKTSSLRFLTFFLALYTLGWTLLPYWTCNLLPFDTIEAVKWGHSFQWGNGKHPPLSGWLAHLSSQLGGYADFPLYLLSALCVLTALIYIYKLAREFFDVEKAVAAALLPTLLFFYNVWTPSFNVNVLQMALWPVSAYYFYRAVREDRLQDWILLGVIAAVSLLTKYSGLLLYLTFFIYMLADPHARKRFRSSGFYLSCITTLVLITPYILDLIQTGGLPFAYASGRMTVDETSAILSFLRTFASLFYPFAIMWAVVQLVSLPEIVIQPFRPLIPPHNKEAFRFSGFLLWIPLGFMLLLSLCGKNIHGMWAFPVYFGIGIWILSYLPETLPARTFKRLMFLLSLFAAGVLTGYTLHFLCKTKLHRHFDPAAMASAADSYYRNECDTRIPLVFGQMWNSCIIHHYLPYRPGAWVDEDAYDILLMRDKLKRDGGLFVASPKSAKRLEHFLNGQGIPSPVKLKETVFNFSAPFGKTDTARIIFGIIPPAQRTSE